MLPIVPCKRSKLEQYALIETSPLFMTSRSSSPELSPLDIGTEYTPLPVYKEAATTEISFSDTLSPPLRLHEDLKSGCGGQLWPAGMVLATHMLRYHRHDLDDAPILELGAGGGLVGLAVALGCRIKAPLYITDQESMLPLMIQNAALNHLERRVVPFVLDWGEPLPNILSSSQPPPTTILAADCVYFEPAFPLLLITLSDLLDLSPTATIYFCFKKRRRADLQFMKSARKKFLVEEIEDQDRPVFSREGLFLYTFRRKSRGLGHERTNNGI